MIKITTAGDSHGEKMVGILEGMPSNLYIDYKVISRELNRRSSCYGRSARSSKESNNFKIISGIRDGKTTGNPICIEIPNDVKDVSVSYPTVPRPGHADLVGSIKYNQTDTRNAIERSSARETVVRVALGAIARQFLSKIGVSIISFTTLIGEEHANKNYYNAEIDSETVYNSPVRTTDSDSTVRMCARIDAAKADNDSLGGEVQTVISGLPIGLGSYSSSELRIDSIISKNIISIPSAKGICFGRNLFRENIVGSQYHDIPRYDNGKIFHSSNNAGGVEAGITNGEDLVFDVVFKPIPTLLKPLDSFDIVNKQKVLSIYERSDITQVPASCTVIENISAYVITGELLRKFGGDSMEEFLRHYETRKGV